MPTTIKNRIITSTTEHGHIFQKKEKMKKKIVDNNFYLEGNFSASNLAICHILWLLVIEIEILAPITPLRNSNGDYHFSSETNQSCLHHSGKLPLTLNKGHLTTMISISIFWLSSFAYSNHNNVSASVWPTKNGICVQCAVKLLAPELYCRQRSQTIYYQRQYFNPFEKHSPIFTFVWCNQIKIISQNHDSVLYIWAFRIIISSHHQHNQFHATRMPFCPAYSPSSALSIGMKYMWLIYSERKESKHI